MLAKRDMPKQPFFLFDLEKAVRGEKEILADELLKQTFFTEEKGDNENKLSKHGFQKQLVKMLEETKTTDEVIDYLKTLTPSGVELEFISLGSFQIGSDKAPG